MLNEINDWCDKHGRIFIVAFDEAQYLRFFNKRFDLLLSWSIDNLKNIYVCLIKVKTMQILLLSESLPDPGPDVVEYDVVVRTGIRTISHTYTLKGLELSLLYEGGSHVRQAHGASFSTIHCFTGETNSRISHLKSKESQASEELVERSPGTPTLCHASVGSHERY